MKGAFGLLYRPKCFAENLATHRHTHTRNQSCKRPFSQMFRLLCFATLERKIQQTIIHHMVCHQHVCINDDEFVCVYSEGVYNCIETASVEITDWVKMKKR